MLLNISVNFTGAIGHSHAGGQNFWDDYPGLCFETLALLISFPVSFNHQLNKTLSRALHLGIMSPLGSELLMELWKQNER